MTDNDLIRRGDAREILEDEGFLVRSLERLAALPAVTPAPNAAAIREAALREAAAEVQRHLTNWANDLADTRDAYREAVTTGKMNGRNISEAAARKFARDFDERAEAVAESVEHTRDAILALIPKGGNGRRVYMGQIMAECDCPREAECQAAGRCIAEERR